MNFPRLTAALIVVALLVFDGRAARVAGDEVVQLAFDQPDKNGTPQGWKRVLKEGSGAAKVIGTGQDAELHTETAEGLLRFERELDLEATAGLRISWEWKVAEMPETPEFKEWDAGGRKAPYRTNSPIQVLVAFRSGRSVYVMHYIWEPTVEVGATWYEQETKYGVVTMKYVRQVLQSGKERMQEWHPHEQDVIADFKKLYPGKKVPRIVMVAIQCTSGYATGAGARSRAAITKLRLLQKSSSSPGTDRTGKAE
jgi:hypothetical protein